MSEKVTKNDATINKKIEEVKQAQSECADCEYREECEKLEVDKQSIEVLKAFYEFFKLTLKSPLKNNFDESFKEILNSHQASSVGLILLTESLETLSKFHKLLSDKDFRKQIIESFDMVDKILKNK